MFNLKSSLLALSIMTLTNRETHAVFKGVELEIISDMSRPFKGLSVQYKLVREGDGDVQSRICATSEMYSLSMMPYEKIKTETIFKDVTLPEGYRFTVYVANSWDEGNTFPIYHLVPGREITSRTKTAKLNVVVHKNSTDEKLTLITE